MPVYVGRHAFSEANDRKNMGTLAFAHPQAPLNALGREQSVEMGKRFVEQGIQAATTPVAVSGLRRSQETAELAGFYTLVEYEGLNEVVHGLELTTLGEMLDAGQLPPRALKTAECILADPPKEPVWITHGLVIAGLWEVLGLAPKRKLAREELIPRHCEIRLLPI